MPPAEEDRTRIREETFLREEIRKEIAETTHEKKGLFAILNSPFIITVIAGLALSLLSQMFVRANAKKEEALAQEKANREKMASIITSAANDISTYESMKGSWQKRKAWLSGHTSENDEWHGRSHSDVYADYYELWKMMMQARKPDAVFAEIRSFYCGDDVGRLVGKLAGALDALSGAQTEDAVEPLIEEMDRIFESLVAAMGMELRRVTDGKRVCGLN
jgi:hypothetical protein